MDLDEEGTWTDERDGVEVQKRRDNSNTDKGDTMDIDEVDKPDKDKDDNEKELTPKRNVDVRVAPWHRPGPSYHE